MRFLSYFQSVWALYCISSTFEQLLAAGCANKVPRSVTATYRQFFGGRLRSLCWIGAAGVALALPANARAESLDSANKKLGEFGLPPMISIPPGFTPAVKLYGQGNIRYEVNNPVMVQFAYPEGWVLQATSVNGNGESGTISANDYFKGDSAFLFVPSAAESNRLNAAAERHITADEMQKFISLALSQKGDLVDSLVLQRVYAGSQAAGAQPYTMADFTYQLNTAAGFLIERCGVAAVTLVSDPPQTVHAKDSRTSTRRAPTVDRGKSEAAPQLQGLLAVTTAKRWRKSGMEPVLRTVAESFRVNKINTGVFFTG